MIEGQSKIGHSCCGCCCDSKRAVIIIEIVFGILFNAIGIDVALTAIGVRVPDDPSLEDNLREAGIIGSIFYGVGIGVAIAVIFGANMYSIWLVAVGILWNVIQTTCSIVFTYQAYQDSNTPYPVTQAVIPIIVSVLLIYPHSAFIYEVYSGIMGKNNHAVVSKK